MIQIQPYNTLGKTITQIEIPSIQVFLNDYAQWPIQCYDSEGNLIFETNCKLSTEEYENWGEDDFYVIAKTCEKLGIELPS